MTLTETGPIDVPLLASYSADDTRFDEAVGPDGRLRDAWQQLAPSLDRLGLDEVVRMRHEASRLLDAAGVSYNVGSAAGAAHAADRDRTWELDPLPLPLGAREWKSLSRGVSQRAHLLDLLLADLYGPRSLIERGVLPPEVVLGHGGFVPQVDGVRTPGPHQLLQYAADLARTAGGGWVVEGDRVGAPSGAAYALENRAVVSRLFPGVYRDAQVQRLSPYFRALRRALQEAAPLNVESPRVVLLTPGVHSETAFEHAVLATRLGFPLVVGSDLTVRDSRVWVRTLDRLEPVDVILRRVDATWCDPLDLRSDSRLGVPGLVAAVRKGTVTVVNSLGSGVLENAGLMPFLPAVARALLGEDLLLDSVPTYWCGESASCDHVLNNLDTLVLKMLSAESGGRSVFGSELTTGQRAALSERITTEPWAWAAQERVEPSWVPTVVGRELQQRQLLLRAFSVAHGGEYQVMPGGLARVAPEPDSLRISNSEGAITKDVWVLAGEPEQESDSWLLAGPNAEALESSATLSPRVAENLFWLGRHAERAEGTIRMLRVVHGRNNDFLNAIDAAGAECLRTLLTAVTEVSSTYPGFVGEGAAARFASPDAELLSLVVDRERAGSVAFSARNLTAAALEVRDQLSQDTWLVLGDLDRSFDELEHLAATVTSVRRRAVLESRSQDVLTRALQSLLALAGLQAESLVRDQGWRFLDVGRRIERAQNLTSLLHATLSPRLLPAAEWLVIESVLQTAESIVTYRRRYPGRARVATVLDLLLLDAENPRSVAFQLERALDDLWRLPGGATGDGSPHKQLSEVLATLRDLDTARLATPEPGDGRPELEQALSALGGGLRGVADALEAMHFRHQAPPRPFVGVGGGWS